MATLDFTPLFRSSVGFDRLPDLLSDALGRESGYPPYNIEKCGEDQYRIVMALAGYSRDEVEIVLEHNRLSSVARLKDHNGTTYLHRGIASRAVRSPLRPCRLHRGNRARRWATACS